jgi:hypothetical protein
LGLPPGITVPGTRGALSGALPLVVPLVDEPVQRTQVGFRRL